TLAATGAPNDAYSLVINIITGAATLAAGTATAQISLDGGQTFGPVITIPSSGVIALSDPQGRTTGVTLTWTYTSGTAFVAGDKFTVACTAPGYTSSDLTTALNALFALPQDWAWLHIVGPAATVSGAASLAAAVDTLMTSAQNAYRYGFAVLECPQDTDA